MKTNTPNPPKTREDAASSRQLTTWREQKDICLDRVLAARQDLSMHDACAEALMLRARLAERDKDVIAAHAALAEAHALAASLEWLPLEQRINTEIRRLGAKGDQ